MTEVKKNILIVDDSLLWVERLISMLLILDYAGEILHATSYTEAIPHLASQPGVIFLDINLPGKSGIELLRFIKKQGVYQGKICMVSNYADPTYRLACKHLGADEFLDKSNDFDRIPEFIQKLSNA